MLDCFFFEKFCLHNALGDFESISWDCTKLSICQSIDCEQIFDVTFEPPPPPPYWKILRTPLVRTGHSSEKSSDKKSCLEHLFGALLIHYK